MKKQMTLLYIFETGNVLAVLTRAASPAAPPGDLTDAKKRELELLELGELVGAEMLVNRILKAPLSGNISSDVEFSIAFDNLGVFTTDLDADVLSDPRSFYFSKTDKQVKPSPVSVQAAVLTSNSEVEIELPAAVTEETNLWVLIKPVGSGPTKPQIAKGVIEKNDPDQKQKITIRPVPNGTYSLLAVATGYQPAVFTDTLP